MNYKAITQALVDKLGGQVPAAEEIGVTQPTISGWLAGGAIKGNNLIKLMEAAEKHDIVGASLKSRRNRPDAGPIISELDIKFGAGGGGVEHSPLAYTENGISISDDAVRDGGWVLSREFLQANLRVNPNKVCIVEVAGDSGYNPDNPHAPGSLFHGDRVIVDMADTVPTQPGAFALFDGAGLVIKLLEVIHGTDPIRYELKSRNPTYRAYEVLQDEVRIIGRVKGRITTL